CRARASSDLAFVGEWLARHCKATLRFEPRSSVDDNTRFIDGRQLFGPSKTIRGIVISLGNRIGSRPSLPDWTVGSGHLDGWRPVLELFEAPNSPRPQQ